MKQVTHLGYPLSIQGVDGNRVACQVAGPAGAQPVILSSGIGCGPVFYRYIAPLLARDYRVIYWEYRGHGSSDLAPDGRGYSMADHAKDLEAVVRSLAARPPFMVGFSMGVQVILEWTRRFDTRDVPAFVFLLGMPGNPLRSHWFWGSAALKRYGRLLLDGGADKIVPFLHPLSKAVLRNRLSYHYARRWGLVSQDFSYPDFLEFIRYSSGVRPDAWLRTGLGVLEHDALDAWGALDKPTLFLAAERDVLVPARECRTASGLLPNGQYGELAGRSHAGTVESGRELARMVRAFVDEVEWGRRRRDAFAPCPDTEGRAPREPVGLSSASLLH